MLNIMSDYIWTTKIKSNQKQDDDGDNHDNNIVQIITISVMIITMKLIITTIVLIII